MQQGLQRFTFCLVKLRLHVFWPGRFLREARYAFLLEGVDRITHGLGRTAQIPGNFFGTLLSTGRQQNLTSTQGKGI